MHVKNRLKGNPAAIRGLVFAILSILAMCFIFSQSILSREESGNLSAGIVQWLKPILDPGGVIAEETFHHYLRKAAHFTEFAIFGCFFCAFTVNLGWITNRKYVALAPFIPLSVAVSDEFIQYFTGRGSMVTDVVIDFSGGLSGVLFVWLISYIISHKKLPQ